MKLALISTLLLFVALSAQSPNPDLGLPELNTIKSATLSPSYSCRSRQEFQTGYASTALFLSSYSQNFNSPDLLFNGACGSDDNFQGSTAGDDMSLIADLGAVPLEEVTSSKAFNFKRVHSFDLYSRFSEEVAVQANHTYVVLINKSGLRGLFVFSVVNYLPNKKVELRYAVKEYQLLTVKAQAEGFSWDAKNTQPCSPPQAVGIQEAHASSKN